VLLKYYNPKRGRPEGSTLRPSQIEKDNQIRQAIEIQSADPDLTEREIAGRVGFAGSERTFARRFKRAKAAVEKQKQIDAACEQIDRLRVGRK